MSDYIVRAVSTDGKIRAFAAITTEMASEAQKIHNTYPVATAALGRTLTAAAMMGSMLKGEKDTLTLQIKGNGPLGGIAAITDANANVKGYVHNPEVDLPPREDGKLDVGSAVGHQGYLGVIKDLGLKEPYAGQVELVSGEIAEDLTLYFAQSEQIPTAIALGVLVGIDPPVKAAGGFIIQLMPEADDAVAAKIEELVTNIPSVTNMIMDGLSGEDILKKVLDGFELNISERIPTKYYCGCTRERVERALISMGRQELQDMIDEQGSAEITCHFCPEVYQFEKEHLVDIMERSSR